MYNIKYLFNPSCCGYYCLKYILKRKKVRKIKFMSIYEISEVLKKNNYYCMCVRVNEVKNMLCECLTLLKKRENVYHYIIVKSIKKGFVYIYDPLYLCVRKMKISKFKKIWSGICLFYTKI